METSARSQLVARTVVAAATAFALEPSLAAIAEGARTLAGARFAAVGLPGPDPEEFSHFVSAGLTEAEIEAIGPLPRMHGLLGAVLAEARPLRVADIRADPRARRWWPAAHPPMTALVGVPLRAGQTVVGALYAANAAGEPAFDPAAEAALGALADAAAPLVQALRRADEGRVALLAAERARMARDLHDGLSQALFSIGLRAEAARRELATAPERAREQVEGIAELARAARVDLSAVVAGLRAPAAESEGLVPALAGLVALLDRLGEAAVTADLGADPPLEPERAREVFLILQEALVNALRHAGARSVRLELRAGDGVVAEVRDDGRGFDPSDPRARAGRIGLGAMAERAAALGADLRIDSGSQGTRVTLRVADG